MVTDEQSLTVRPYSAEADFPLVNDWWQARHGAMADLPQAMLPPLGVIVEDSAGPLFALWCYESAGVGVAFIEWPVSRPGLTVAQTREAFQRAVESIILTAGKCWNPPGDYNVFRANVCPAVFRSIKEMGFVREYQDEYFPVILNLSPETS